jgi:peptidoglycan/xylan/chitin deacetylase (PgdA/CDA1 family)
MLLCGALAISPLVVSSPAALILPIGTTQQPARSCPRGHVALTFDDGPVDPTTMQIAEELRANGEHGVFFFIGALSGARPDIVRSVRAVGMEVGNHTYDHPFLDTLPASAVRDEIVATNEILDGLAGPAPVLFRPPYGRSSTAVRAAAHDLGMTEVLWTYDSDDYAASSVDQMVSTAAKAKDGDILLFHDGYDTTVVAIRKILRLFAERGICTGKVVATARRQQAWVDYPGDDRTYFYAAAAPW